MNPFKPSATRFPRVHRMSILEVGSRGACDDVDAIVMSELLEMGFVEVRQPDRCVVLTECGQRAYEELRECQSGRQSYRSG